MNDLEALNAERRKDWRDLDAPYQERWFPGTHGSIGGGGDIRGLSDGALNWILDGAKKAGLILDTARGTRINGFAPDTRVTLVNERNPRWSLTQIVKTDRDGPEHIWQLSPSTVRRWHSGNPDGSLYRPPTLNRVADALNAVSGDEFKPRFDKIKAMHKVQPGDVLTRLALKYYGDPKLSKAIFDANRDLLDNEHEIFSGWELRIPEIDNTNDHSGVTPPA